MTNFQVYRKTLSFSLLAFAVDILALLAFLGITTAGFFIFINVSPAAALIGLLVGFILGIVVASLINIFVTNRVKAAQIAMMVKGVTEGSLPEHTFHEGFVEIRGRFGKITAFYFITRAIRSIFRQIGRGINRVATAVGGQVGNSVSSVIDSAIQTLIGYLCDCCLGWILYRKEVNAAKAGCEGAVIFFKHGKTLIRNIGRIFGMGFLSLLLVGGGVFAIFFAIFYNFPKMFTTLGGQIASAMGSDAPEFLTEPTLFIIFVSVFLAVVIWAILHSVLIRPFILVGVMRNFMTAGIKDIPTEQDFAVLDSKSPKFRKLHGTI